MSDLKILRYRTVAIIYPCLSLEAEVLAGGKKIYVNVDVEEPVEIRDDFWWAYEKPLDQLEADDFEHVVDVDGLKDVVTTLVEWWKSEHREFVHDEEWRDWNVK